MPGYTNWEQLYREEFQALTMEGYDTAAALSPKDGQNPLPFPGQSDGAADGDSEAFWEAAYERLWAIRDRGLRVDYPYAEPISFADILIEAAPVPQLWPLSPETYAQRIAGAVYGRISGVVLGKPLEMGLSREKIREYLESVDAYPLRDYVPEYSPKLDMRLREDCIPSTLGHVAWVQPDDDIHFTILPLLMAEKHGLAFTSTHVGYNFLDNFSYHWCWCANRQAYWRMVNLTDDSPKEMQIAQIPWKLNPWRECIDGQIRCDLWGYISPADPRRAADMAYRDCSFSLVKNGVYGGMFVAGCIAAALTEEPTVDRILDGGLSVIPKKSRLAEAICFVREKYRTEKEWIPVCQAIEKRYGDLPFAGTINNMAMVVLALLHGNLDYEKTITTAVMCGIDTDCNAGTAGSICGAAIGETNIPRCWIDPYNDTIKTALAEFGQGRISELIQRIIALYKKHK